MSCRNEVTRAESHPQTVQQGVQAGDGEAPARQWEELESGCPGARYWDQRTVAVESDGRSGREDGPDARRTRGAQAAPQGQGAPRDGGRDLGKSDGLLRQPKQVRFGFIE